MKNKERTKSHPFGCLTISRLINHSMISTLIVVGGVQLHDGFIGSLVALLDHRLTVQLLELLLIMAELKVFLLLLKLEVMY